DPTLFFTNDIFDSHIGLAINIDWFQLFDYTVHSTGVIYGLVDFAFSIDLLAIFEYKKGCKIYIALILSSNDIPAARKICDNASHTFNPVDITKYFNAAKEWLNCTNKQEKDDHVSKTG
ncbi:2000_t:CDS:2, partial [Scutellospora calospora]